MQITLAQTVAVTTPNQEVQEIFNEAISQYIGWFGNPIASLEKALQQDSQLLMAHVVLLAFDLLGTGVSLNSTVILDRVKNIDQIVEQRNSSEQELNHVKALKIWIRGDFRGAADVWEEIMSKHPDDTLALKFAHDTYFYLGDSFEIYNSVHRVIGHYDKGLGTRNAHLEQDLQTRKDLFTLGYVLGMYAFGLEEIGKYEEAEKIGRRALQINKNDAWALHAVVHVMEMQGRQEEGIQFMSEREPDWKDAVALACHNYWHWALYAIEQGDFEQAIQIFDLELCERIKSGAMLDLVDGASLLFRLHMEGKIDRNDCRWSGLQSLWEPHLDDHTLTFNDMHIAMSYAPDSALHKKFAESWKHFINRTPDDKNNNLKVAQQVGDAVLNSIWEFGRGNYERAVEYLYPVYKENKIITMGGSHAQRDVVEQLLLFSLLRVPSKHHILQCLLQERKHRKPSSGVTDRLLARSK